MKIACHAFEPKINTHPRRQAQGNNVDPAHDSHRRLSSCYSLKRAKQGDLGVAGGAGGLLRLRRPARRCEVAEVVGLLPASRVGCSLGHRVSRFRVPGGVEAE
jgi:hypothetical protein